MHSVLQEIYILVSKVKFSGEYVEKLPPAERKLQLLYYEQELAEAKKQQNKSSGISMSALGNDME